MNDDMRLKSIVVKGSKVGTIPCLKICDKAAKCPCEKLQKFLGDKSPSDISCLEMEWMHIPTYKDSSFWMKLVFPIVATILLSVLFLAKGCSFTQSTAKLKVSLSENGCRVQCWTDSAESFEKKTNDIIRIKKDWQMIKSEGDK